MEKNIVRKIKRYSIQKGGEADDAGDILDLKRTQEELLHTLVTLKNSKLPEKERFKQNLQNIFKQLDKYDDLLKIGKVEKGNDDELIFNKLSNYDKFLNGVPDTKLDFDHLKMEAPIKPPLKLNVDNLLKLDKIIDSLGKVIDFEPRKETVNIIPISKISNDQTPITFNPRNETVGIGNISKLSNDLKPISFNPRNETVGIGSISKISNEENPISFTPRDETVKINPLDKIKIKSETFDFKPRNEKVKLENLIKTKIDSVSYDINDYKSEMESAKLFVSDNKEKLQKIISLVDKELDIYIKYTEELKKKTVNYKKEFNVEKIKEAVNEIIPIKIIGSEIIEINGGLDTSLEPIIPKIYEKDSEIKLNKKQYYIESIDFDDDNFIDNLIDKNPDKIDLKILKIRLNLSGGAYLDDFLEISKEYENIIKKRKFVIKDFTDTISEYNTLFIQYFNFKFFLLKNIQKFFTKTRHIYQYLSFESVQKYLRTLEHLNKVISERDKMVYSSVSVNNVHTKMYFKHFLVIKILYHLFDEINKKWEQEKWDKTFMIDLFSAEIDKFENKPQVNLSIYLLIFNFYFNTLDKYEEIFRF